MKIRYPLVATLLLASAANLCAAKGSLRIHDQGLDGDSRYYTVYCPNGSRGSIIRRFDFSHMKPVSDEVRRARVGASKPPKFIETCILSSDRRQCSKKWTLDDAALVSCR